MNIVEESKLELNSKHVAYTYFILDFRKDVDNLYCFYEGNEDSSYYPLRVNLSSKSSQQKYHYICNGKSSVIELEELINRQPLYSKSKLLFFIDKDYDDNLNISSNIYCTKFYSVENFYTVDDAFKNILINEYHIQQSNENFIKALEIFSNTKEEFHNKIINLNSWLSCQADYRNTNQISTRLKIDKSLKKYFGKDVFDDVVKQDFSIDLHSDIEDFSKYPIIFPDAPQVDLDKFEAKLEIFKNSNRNEIFRGKFELKFLVSFLKRFQNNISSSNNNFTQKYSCPLRYEYITSYSQLSNNAITHDCLIEYIRNIAYTV